MENDGNLRVAMLTFEWNEDKNRRNRTDHGISFEQAKAVFSDRHVFEKFDERFEYGEERVQSTGLTRLVCSLSSASNAAITVALSRPGARQGKKQMSTSRTEAEMDELSEIPMTEEEYANARPVPRARSLRRALGLTQEAFSQTYQIPLATLIDWEEGRTEPDAPAQALLKVIAQEPKMTAVALERRSAA